MSTYRIQKYTLSTVKESNYQIDRTSMTNKKDVAGFCKKYLEEMPLENVCIIALDSGNKIVGFQVSEGATNQCALYPANVFRFLLSTNASCFIMAHNHPGGNTNPSTADWNITKRLYDAGKLLDTPLLDGLIITEDTVISMRELDKWPS